MIFAEGCTNPKTVSILIRANSKMMLMNIIVQFKVLLPYK